MVSVKDELESTNKSELSNVNYKILYDEKVQKLLEGKDVASAVDGFAQSYNEITTKSPILRQNFQYHNVTQIQQQLKANNFFSAGHTINLADENTDEKEEVSSDQSLLGRIEEERQRVLNDPDVSKKFDAFNSKLKNKELQAFRDYITKNKHLLPMLSDLEGLKRAIWMQYLLASLDEYKSLVEEYEIGQDALAGIIADAENSRGDWDDVVADFNRRFLYLPFEIVVENKADTILKGNAPSVGFIIREGAEERRYAPSEKQTLLRALSSKRLANPTLRS